MNENIYIMSSIKLFEDKRVRRHWDEAKKKWYFSVIDAVDILTNSADAHDYWFKMKIIISTEDGIELSTICRQLKMEAADGKRYSTDCAND